MPGLNFLQYFTLLQAAFGAYLAQAGSFRVGAKRVTITHAATVEHLSLANFLLAAETAFAGADTQVQVGAVSITVSEWAAPTS